MYNISLILSHVMLVYFVNLNIMCLWIFCLCCIIHWLCHIFPNCNILWANTKSNVDTILLLQKKAIRLCTNSYYRDHSNPLFAKLKTLKAGDIHILQIALFMFRLQHGQLPSYFSPLFNLNKDIHSYPTRQTDKFHLRNPKTVLALKSIRHTGPDIWNSLPNEIRNLNTLYSFKKAVKTMLLCKY